MITVKQLKFLKTMRRLATGESKAQKINRKVWYDIARKTISREKPSAERAVEYMRMRYPRLSKTVDFKIGPKQEPLSGAHTLFWEDNRRPQMHLPQNADLGLAMHELHHVGFFRKGTKTARWKKANENPMTPYGWQIHERKAFPYGRRHSADPKIRKGMWIGQVLGDFINATQDPAAKLRAARQLKVAAGAVAVGAAAGGTGAAVLGTRYARNRKRSNAAR